MTRVDFGLVSIVAAIGSYAVWQSQRHPPAFPLGNPWGSYSTRAEAFDAVARIADAGTCAKVDPVNDQQTEVQPC